MNSEGDLIVYTTSWCSDCHRAKFLLDEYGIAYDERDIERDAAALAYVLRVNGGRRTVPTLVFPDGSILVEPSTALLVQKLGIQL